MAFNLLCLQVGSDKHTPQTADPYEETLNRDQDTRALKGKDGEWKGPWNQVLNVQRGGGVYTQAADFWRPERQSHPSH